MHQHTHPHAFTPILHSLTILPAPVVSTQDSKFNTHLPRGTAKPSFAPVTAFHRATQKSFGSTKRGRWGALHVCIAWKIYYHEQLKKMQQKPKRLHLTPEYPASSLPDSVQHDESDQPSCRRPHLDSPCGHSRKTAENVSHLSRSYPSDHYTSPPATCHSRSTEGEKLDRERLEQALNLRWREKLAEEEEERHRAHQTDTAKDLPRRTPELDGGRGGSLDRKRQLECDSFIQVKRVKLEIAEDQIDPSQTLRTDPSPFSTTHTHPPSHAVPVRHINIGDLSVLYPNSSGCSVARAPGGLMSYPGAEMHPYQTASWEPTLDVHRRMELHSGQNVLKDMSLKSGKAIRIPLVAQRQKEAFHGFFTPPLYLPLGLRQQETVYLRGREFLHSRHEDRHLHHCGHQLPHPGFLAASYPGP